jgi:peptidoglycan/LPS O-acetylase OafA/YrhL
MHTHPGERLEGVQILRGLAALAVLGVHLQSVEAQYGAESLTSPAWLMGFAGVDLFFVISGFIMVYITGGFADRHDVSDRLQGVRVFLFSRLMRVYPLWWLLSLAVVAVAFVRFGVPYDPTHLGAQTPTGYLTHSFLLLPQRPFPVIPVGWTLIHELFFYVFFAVILVFPRKLLPHLLVLWAVAVTAGAAAGFSRPVAHALPEVLTHPLSLEFLAGAGLGLFWRRLPLWVGPTAVIAGLAWLVGAAFVLNIQTVPEVPLFWDRIASFGVGSWLLVAGVVVLDRARIEQGAGALPGPFRPLVALGDWSYALYLCHLPVVVAGASFVWAPLAQPGPLDNVLALVLLAAVSISVAAALHRFVERPLLAFVRRVRDGT